MKNIITVYDNFFDDPHNAPEDFFVDMNGFDSHVAVEVESMDHLKAIQSNKKCSYKFMMGYSGWSPGQLESEIENGDWVIQETSSDFIFNDDGQMWDIAIGSFGVEISNFSAHGGSA